MMTAETTLPPVNALNRPFWDAAEDGRLVLPHCTATSRPFWPPSPVSPYPEGRDVDWREVAAVGTILARVTYRRPFQQAFAPLLPYAIAMVALDAGPRLLVHLSDPDSPASPQAGARVGIGFARLLDGGAMLPVVVAAPTPEQP